MNIDIGISNFPQELAKQSSEELLTVLMRQRLVPWPEGKEPYSLSCFGPILSAQYVLAVRYCLIPERPFKWPPFPWHPTQCLGPIATANEISSITPPKLFPPILSLPTGALHYGLRGGLDGTNISSLYADSELGGLFWGVCTHHSRFSWFTKHKIGSDDSRLEHEFVWTRSSSH